jgi:hypothetical protein
LSEYSDLITLITRSGNYSLLLLIKYTIRQSLASMKNIVHTRFKPLFLEKMENVSYNRELTAANFLPSRSFSWRRVSTTGLVVTLDCLLVWLAKDCSDGDRLNVPPGNVADAVALFMVSYQLLTGRMVGNFLLAGVDV